MYQLIAEIASRSFEGAERADGTQFRKLKDGTPAWVTEIIHTAHGDMMPDDQRYRLIEQVFDVMAQADADATLDDLREKAFDEVEADIYTHDLTEWLHSRTDRTFYLSEALDEFGGDLDGFQALGMAQLKELHEVVELVLKGMEEEADVFSDDLSAWTLDRDNSGETIYELSFAGGDTTVYAGVVRGDYGQPLYAFWGYYRGEDKDAGSSEAYGDLDILYAVQEAEAWLDEHGYDDEEEDE